MAEELLKEASLLRESGDTTNALARLQTASERDPRNARVLAEMAMIYESIQLFDRSNETWRKIQEIGPAAGPLYELADMKLKVGAVPSTRPPLLPVPGLRVSRRSMPVPSAAIRMAFPTAPLLASRKRPSRKIPTPRRSRISLCGWP